MTQEQFFKRYTYTPSRDRIGGGGFGTVYKAKDNLLHRTVAIKVSEVKTTADGNKTFSLKDEFEALNHVPKHPNIANYEEFYSFESPQGLFDYAVMQYYPDGNLSNAIKNGLTAEQKEDIAVQLLEGISFLHKHKVVHRDLKPGNILIVKDGGRIIPLITDFGLSKATGMGENSVFSNSFGAGTPKYSSPEQLQGNPLRLNTDLWSYGAILYELFTGEQLFNASSGAANTAQADMEVYNKIVNGNVQNLGKMPEKWRKVAERCLVVDPAKRTKDAGELFAIIKGDDDETIGPSSGSGTTTGPKMPTNTPPINKPSQKDPHSGPAPLSPTPNDKPGNKKGLWIGLGITAAVIVALLLLLKPKQEPTPTDPDTQAYESCQTIDDYRAYIRDFGRNAVHYNEAKQFVHNYIADSIAQAKLALPETKAQQQVEIETVAITKTEAEQKEDVAYQKCSTIEACDSYLKTYPQGRYVLEVKKKRLDMEERAKEEAINNVFSVSASRKVRFSKSNLQYQASTNKWRFAPNPWDIIGNANSNISETYKGWIDLFGWGTSGWESGARCYQPYSASTENSDYCSGGADYHLTGKFAKADWGWHCGNSWRTPTIEEWDYVLHRRNTNSGILYAKAKLSGIKGVILLPDNWGNNHKLNSTNNSKADYNSNIINAETWNTIFAPAGAVFLPAAGYRQGTSVIESGSGGNYWSVSYYGENLGGSVFYFDNDHVSDYQSYAFMNYSDGLSVRLVTSVQ